ICRSLYYSASYIVFFFFSSRRRHTRLVSDWSSDVCSSDLAPASSSDSTATPTRTKLLVGVAVLSLLLAGAALAGQCQTYCGEFRSEERRVGKEGRAGGARFD